MDQLIHTDMRSDPTAWLTEHGWRATDHPVNTVAERYHRDLAEPRLVSRIRTADGSERTGPVGQALPAVGYTTACKP